MDKHEAKEILTLYRPGSADRDDPEFREAIDHARRDAELRLWFDQHCRVQESLRAKFRQITVPEGLREQILSERKVYRAAWKRPEVVLAGVAVLALALLLGVARFWSGWENENTLASLHIKIRNTILREYSVHMDIETNDLGQIEQHLQKKGHGQYEIPKTLAQTMPTGGGVLQWHAKDVSMVCFNSVGNPSPKSSDLFLFIIDRNELANPPGSAPTVKPDKQLSTVSWSEGNKTYVLAGLGDAAFVRKHL